MCCFCEDFNCKVDSLETFAAYLLVDMSRTRAARSGRFPVVPREATPSSSNGERRPLSQISSNCSSQLSVVDPRTRPTLEGKQGPGDRPVGGSDGASRRGPEPSDVEEVDSDDTWEFDDDGVFPRVDCVFTGSSPCFARECC